MKLDCKTLLPNVQVTLHAQHSFSGQEHNNYHYNNVVKISYIGSL